MSGRQFLNIGKHRYDQTNIDVIITKQLVNIDLG